MQSAEDSAAIAVRILQRRERERVVEAAERNEVASLREYAATLEARLNGLYAEQDMAALLRPRGIMRRLARVIGVALLGAGGVLLFQITTPLGARLTDSLRKRSLSAVVADIGQAVRGLFRPSTSSAPALPQPTSSAPPAVPQPTPPPAPIVVQEPAPRAAAVPISPPAATQVAPVAQTIAPVVATPRSESRRHAPSRHAQPRKEVQGREVQEAVIPACSENDPLCGISKRPH